MKRFSCLLDTGLLLTLRRRQMELFWNSITTVVNVTDFEEVAAVKAEVLILLLVSFFVFPPLHRQLFWRRDQFVEGGLPTYAQSSCRSDLV